MQPERDSGPAASRRDSGRKESSGGQSKGPAGDGQASSEPAPLPGFSPTLRSVIVVASLALRERLL